SGPGGPRVRITPQLIRVKDDIHVWAESYDQGVENIFEVQAEISRRVISQLDLSLMPGERWRPRQPPTQNLEAYHAYLRGLELRNQPFYSEPHIRSSVPMFERAVGRTVPNPVLSCVQLRSIACPGGEGAAASGEGTRPQFRPAGSPPGSGVFHLSVPGELRGG